MKINDLNQIAKSTIKLLQFKNKQQNKKLIINLDRLRINDKKEINLYRRH